MKKCSLLALSLASLVGLVGCGGSNGGEGGEGGKTKNTIPDAQALMKECVEAAWGKAYVQYISFEEADDEYPEGCYWIGMYGDEGATYASAIEPFAAKFAGIAEKYGFEFYNEPESSADYEQGWFSYVLFDDWDEPGRAAAIEGLTYMYGDKVVEQLSVYAFDFEAE